MTDPNQPPPLTISGVLLVDKPAKRPVSSMVVVRNVKRRFMAAGLPKRLKVGHAGTLDPLASGLMIVLVGKATRLCDQMMAREKRYLAEVDFSRWSPTDDLEADTVGNDFDEDFAPPSRERLVSTIAAEFIGEVQQRPPSFSAIWVEGKRAFDLSRRGAPPDLPARPVIIHSIEVLDYRWPLAALDIRCGKGTYIRSLARDLGVAFTGMPAVMSALRRTEIGPYSVAHATPLESLPDRLTESDLLPTLSPERSEDGGA